MRRSPAWLVAALVGAVALAYVTFVGSLLNSCGAGNHGPDEGAEEDFCGYGSGEPTDFSDVFIAVHIVPALPVLAGGLLVFLGRSRLFFAAGVVGSLLATGLIWGLEP
jgi:hypothetical protein